jgi:tetratricopeptide (TPR) repeat protein
LYNKFRFFYFFACLVTFLCVLHVSAATQITLSTQGTPPSAESQSLEESGLEAIHSRDWNRLFSISEEGLRGDPDNPVFYAMKGYSLRKLGRYQEALTADARAIELQPNAVRYANRGITHLAMGNYPAALADARDSLVLDPGYATAYSLEALAWFGLNNNTGAKDAIEKAIALDPEDPSYWHIGGRIALAEGNCTLAIISLQRSIDIDAEYSLPWPSMHNATADLKTAEEQCGILPATGEKGQPAPTPASPPGGFLAILAAAIAVFLKSGRR